MKKLSIVAVATLSIVGIAGIAPAQAEANNAIAIIDTNFDASLISGNVLEVCVASNISCNPASGPRTTSQYQAYNHGTIMADVVRANNPDALLVLIEAGTSATGVVNGIGFDAALDWVIANRDTYNITSISFSYNAGNGSTCKPASPGVIVSKLQAKIVDEIALLKNAGTTVYAASGNYGSGDRIDYPACIDDVVAVGSSLYRGSQKLSDIIIGGFTYTSSELFSNFSSLQDSRQILDSGKYQVRVGNTTSVATAIAAATNN